MTDFRFIATACAVLVLSGCGTSGKGPSQATSIPTLPPTSTGFSSTQPLSIHLAYLRARSYTPDIRLTIRLPRHHDLYVVHSVCTGSADGHCQAVDAFVDGQRAPIFHSEYSAVQSLKPITGGFEVIAQSYKQGDPLCCPSGGTVTDRYVWSGGALTEHGSLPKQPSG